FAHEYKKFLIENKTPAKTINRKLSTLRNLSRFLIISQIINFDFTEDLTNITTAGEERLQIHPLVVGFQKHLEAEKVSASTIKNYLADIRQFISPGLPKITPELLKVYFEEISKGPSQATAKRKIASLKKFVAWAQKQGLIKDIRYPGGYRLVFRSLFGKNIFKKVFYASLQDKIIKRLEQKPRIQKIAHSLFYNRPNWYRTYHDISITNYIHLAILVIFSTALGFGAYNQFFKGTSTPLAYPTALVPPNRYLSFQGRLTDNLGNPITVSTNLVFKLYDAASAGNTLWNAAAAVCAITPDSDGIFSTILGSTCGGAIAATVFSENPNVWVGVKVATDAEALPRIQIATVGYALNAETLQGYPPSATAG
ncbi:MAG: site-specific integrase, partial [bacterium]|nr:site-specific integrase [bacterium]